MDSTYKIIAALCGMRGVSGREHTVAAAAAEMLRPFAPDAAVRGGNVVAHIGSDAQKPSLMLCAHLDQVGFFVTDITPEGFLRIGAVGGMDRRLLLGQRVEVAGTEPLMGVISILPPHLLKGEQAVPSFESLCVDLGFTSAESLGSRVKRGDAVYFSADCKQLLGTRMTAPALDDRCGAAALILAAEQLSKAEDLPCNIIIVLSVQEERSRRGAKISAFSEQPDFGIAVDVTFGLSHDSSPSETYPLGKGPAIGISPVLDQALSYALIAAAEDAKIPYQLEIMTETTGTDADMFALAPQGCAAGTVSIPLRYMHTPAEVIDTADVEQTAALLAAFAGRCGR